MLSFTITNIRTYQFVNTLHHSNDIHFVANQLYIIQPSVTFSLQKKTHHFSFFCLFVWKEFSSCPYLLHSRFHGIPLCISHTNNNNIEYLYGTGNLWIRKSAFSWLCVCARIICPQYNILHQPILWGVWTFNSSAHQSWCICRHLISLLVQFKIRYEATNKSASWNGLQTHNKFLR